LSYGDGGEFRGAHGDRSDRRLIVSTVPVAGLVPSVFTLLDDVGRLTWLVGRSSANATNRRAGDRVLPAHVVYATQRDLKIAAE